MENVTSAASHRPSRWGEASHASLRACHIAVRARDGMGDWRSGERVAVCYTDSIREKHGVRVDERRDGERLRVMTKRYRALGVMASVALIALVLQTVFYLWYTSLVPRPPQSDMPPLGPSALFVVAPEVCLSYLLVILVGLPTVSIFSAIVAGQSRQWTWFTIFLVAGGISWYVGGREALYPVAGFFFPMLPSFFESVLFGMAQLLIVATTLIVQAVPSLLALVFVWLKLRATASAQSALPSQGRHSD